MEVRRIRDWSFRHPAKAGILGFFAGVVLIFLAFDGYSRLRLRSEIRALEWRGIPCGIEGLARRQRNSGASEELTRKLRTLCEKISYEGALVPDPTSRLKCMEWDVLQKFLSDRAEDLRTADRFLEEHPDLTLWIDYSADSSWQLDLSVLNQLRAYGILNHDRFFCALRQRDPAGAVQVFDRSAILWNCLLRRADMFVFLASALTVESSRQDALFDAAFNWELELFDPETLKRWADSMPDVEARFRSGFSHQLSGELGQFAEAAQNPGMIAALLEPSEWQMLFQQIFFGPIHRVESAAAIQSWREMVTPFAEEDFTLETVRKLAPWRGFLDSRKRMPALFVPLSWQFLPDVYSLFRRISQFYARCRVLQTGLAVELFLRKYGRLPETLAELVPEFLPAVPVSPFSGKPLQLEEGTLDFYLPKTETTGKFTGYRVYSDGDPEMPPIGLTRTDRRGRLPAWNRKMKRKTLEQ